MKKPISKAQSQSPYRPNELLPVASFVSYCRDNGVDTSEDELEQLHKEGLFYPAIKVYKGIRKFKNIYAKFGGSLEWKYVDPESMKKFKPIKIDPRNYYSSGGFSRGNDKWLEYYEKNKMVEYPASQKFETWNKKQHPGLITNRKLIERDYEFFYDKTQILNLKIIRRERNFWKDIKGNKKSIFIKRTKQFSSETMKFLEIYFAVEDFFQKPIKLLQKKLEAYSKQGLNRKQAEDQLNEDFDIDIVPVLKYSAQEVLDKYSCDFEYLKYWRRFLAHQSIFSESNRSRNCIRTYLRPMDEKLLIQAEDTNYMIYIINQFLFRLTGKNETVKKILEDSQSSRCSVCGDCYMPKKYNQKTCGKKECVMENKNRSKRKKR